MTAAAPSNVIPLPARATRVLCIYRYWMRDSGKVRPLTAGIMVRAYSSGDVQGAFRRGMSLLGGPELARGYQFISYLPEHGRATW